MENKSLRILAIIFLVVLGLGLFVLLQDKQQKDDEENSKNAPVVQETDALKFKKEYEEVNSLDGAVQMNLSVDSPVKYLNSYHELEVKLDNGDNIVLYLGFPTCPWCRNIIPVLFDVAKENNMEAYYINMRELKNNNLEDYQKIYQLIGDYLTVDEEGNKVLYVPDVYFFKDGKIIGNHRGSVTSQLNPSIALTQEQVDELKSIYQSYFNKFREDL